MKTTRWNRWTAVLSLAVFALPASPRGLARDSADEVTAPAKLRLIELTISGNANEDPGPDMPFGPKHKNFRAKLQDLRRLATDDTVDGVRLEVNGAPDYARCLDLMRELTAVKAAGKKIVCYAETMSQRPLMFASLADLLVLPPSGMVALEGLTVELMYLKDLLALLDVQVDVIHIGNFKTAYEDLARNSMSDEQRKVLGIMLDEFYAQMQTTIAENRGISREQVEGAFERFLLNPEQAKELGLIDAVAYEDEFDAKVRELLGGEVEFDEDYGQEGLAELEKMLNNPFGIFQMLPKLLKPPQQTFPDEPRIAIVYATGPITSGKSTAGFDGTVSSMGSETVVEALETALEDDWVRAVILRVNSPGGSAIASDMIWRATQRVKAKKPIIASMGSVAASGGYWISMGCDRIIAQPSTITGSIGVVGMVPNVSRALERFGIDVEVVGRGPHAEDMAILAKGATPFLKETLRQSMLGVYDEFIRKVAEGRKMNPQILETLARGRVWTGRQAADLNLVDELGGLDRAITVACELGGGLDPATAIVAEYPQPPNFMDQLEEAFDNMTTIEGQAKRLLARAGFGDLVVLAEQLLSGGDRIGAENVQAVLPFQFRMR